MDVISIHDGSDNNHESGSFLRFFQVFLVGFDDSVGHDYIGGFNERYDFYHLKEERLSFGLQYLDKITGGGLPNKTLNIVMAGTGVGKSLFMCDIVAPRLSSKVRTFSTSQWRWQRNVSLERIDANLLDIPIQDIGGTPSILELDSFPVRRPG